MGMCELAAAAASACSEVFAQSHGKETQTNSCKKAVAPIGCGETWKPRCRLFGAQVTADNGESARHLRVCDAATLRAMRCDVMQSSSVQQLHTKALGWRQTCANLLLSPQVKQQLRPTRCAHC